jgi:hypothetical protein
MIGASLNFITKLKWKKEAVKDSSEIILGGL